MKDATPMFSWGPEALRLDFLLDARGCVRIAGLPLAEVLVAGYGRWAAAERALGTVAGGRLAYRGHKEFREDGWLCLRVDLADPDTGLTAQVHLRSPDGISALRSWVRLTNQGEHRLVLESVTSLVLGGIADRDGGVAVLDVWHADNEWLAEGRWQRHALREALVDVNFGRHRQQARSSFSRTSQGTWSTGRHLPLGALTARDGGRTLMWQVENPGGWRWEVGEEAGAAYVALMGPTDRDHQWRHVLDPGETFTTVPAAVAVGVCPDGSGGSDGFAEAAAAMTAYRRALRRPHPDHTDLPVIFNDYMNTLMGDPTTERLLPLIDAAAEAGAEYFVIDAGWYAGQEGWWDLVGEWEESAARFPGGLIAVTDRIRAAGMVPGLWLEPEVVGVRSPLAEILPREAFFQRDGERVVDNGRYHLDLRRPAAVGHLDRVVDRLVADYGVGYLKLDYNVNPGPGTDLDAGSPGAGLLGHQRALLDWLDGVLDRHPGLTLENCASGGMRSDYAMLCRLQLQSTSDQQEHHRYPAIAAAAPAAIAPEQAANWAYPQPEFGDSENAFALCNALLGRVHLSGHLDRMTPEQRALVADAIAVYKRIRADIPTSMPFWPLGLPGWTDPWIALGLRGAAKTYATVWRRPGEDSATGQTLLVPHLKGSEVDVSVLFPHDTKAVTDWSPATGELTVQLPVAGTACLIAMG
jgi:alpha-galactosidase